MYLELDWKDFEQNKIERERHLQTTTWKPEIRKRTCVSYL